MNEFWRRQHREITIMNSLINLIFLMLLGVGAVFLMAILTGLLVMLCWNYLFTGDTSILNVPLDEIGYWQGFVLSFFGGLIFKGSDSPSNSPS
jgi:hypothetical protein